MDPYGGYGFPPQQPPLQAPAAPVAPPVAAVAPPAPLFQAPPPAVAAPFVAPPVPAAAVAPPVAPAPLTPADQGDEWKTEGHPLIGREIIRLVEGGPAYSEGKVTGWLSAAESDFRDNKGQPAALFQAASTWYNTYSRKFGEDLAKWGKPHLRTYKERLDAAYPQGFPSTNSRYDGLRARYAQLEIELDSRAARPGSI